MLVSYIFGNLLGMCVKHKLVFSALGCQHDSKLKTLFKLWTSPHFVAKLLFHFILLSAVLSVNLKMLAREEEISSIRCLQRTLEHPFSITAHPFRTK